MIQLNATYRNIEESIGRLLPQQTKEQLSLLEALVRSAKLCVCLGGLLAFRLNTRKIMLCSAEKAVVTSSDRSSCLARTAGAVQEELVR